MGDHTEVFQVDFDPAVVSFEQLLDIFWTSHNPCGPAWSVQYRSVLFFHDDAQKAVALASASRVAATKGDELTTVVLPVGTFTAAEDYHQKYRLRRRQDLVDALKQWYPSEELFRESTAAAKLNAHLDGSLDLPGLRRALAAVGVEVVGDDRLEGLRALKP